MKKVLSVILMVAIGLSICSAIYASDSEWSDYEESEKKVETIIKNQDIIFPTDDIKTIDKVVGREEADALAEDGIMPLGILCECGGDMYISHQDITPWGFVGIIPCPHGLSGHTCRKYQRTITTVWKCKNIYGDCGLTCTLSSQEFDSYCK